MPDSEYPTRTVCWETFIINGISNKIKWTAVDFRNDPVWKNAVPQILIDCAVHFSPGEKIITMSSDIPKHCQGLTAFHEFYCGEIGSCAEVEEWIVNSLEGEQKEDYIKCRTYMFYHLIKHIYNSGGDASVFYKTFGYLKSLV